jgi:hypothetical protein
MPVKSKPVEGGIGLATRGVFTAATGGRIRAYLCGRRLWPSSFSVGGTP